MNPRESAVLMPVGAWKSSAGASGSAVNGPHIPKVSVVRPRIVAAS